MFTTTCGACGTVAHFEESQLPPSGLITTCAHCGRELSVVPPGMGLTAPATAQELDDGIDLPRPKTRDERAELPDLLAPVGPKPRAREVPDLLAPVGPRPTRGVSDLLQPVGPWPTRGSSHAASPVAPRAQPQVGPPPDLGATSDLLTPVGPSPTKNLPDLLQPVGPFPVRNAPDLLQPVGPIGTKNLPDLLQPVGPFPVRNAPDLVEPVGPRPTKGIDLPAPKGFFDEDPPPQPAFDHHDPTGFERDGDDLDVVPPGFVPQLEPGLPDHSHAGPRPTAGGLQGPFDMADLALGAEPEASPEYEDPAAYGQLDLPATPPDDGLVSFSAPGTGVRTGVSSRPESVGIVEAPKRPRGTLAGEEPSKGQEGAQAGTPAAGAPAARAPRKLPKALVATLATLALLGAGAYYLYTSVELVLFGVMTLPAQERHAQIGRGLADAHRLLTTSDAGHWGAAVKAADRVLALDKGGLEARALAAQAYVARALEEGLAAKDDRDKADALIAEVLKAGGRGREVEKAIGLRSVLNPGKAGEALNALTAAAKSAPSDPDAPLFAGWAALEARAFDKAAEQFEAALKLRPDRQPALVGLGRAQLGLGSPAKAKESFQRVFDKYPDRKHFGAWLALTELETPARDPSGKRERELAVLCDRAPERETAHPRDRSRALTLYGDEAMAGGRFAQASERYRMALTFDGKNLDALVGSALAIVEQRVHSEGNASLVDARRLLEAALTVEPRQLAALIGVVRIDLIEGRAADAQKAIVTALEAGEKDALVHFWRGKVLEDPAIGNLDEAEKAYQRSIELAPADYNPYVAFSQLELRRARTADKGGKKAESRAYTEKAVAVLAPIAESARGDKLMANILGNAYLGARDSVRAEEWFRAALAADPTFVDARANLAMALEGQGKLTEATAEWQRAYQEAPKREDVALSLAWAYEKARNLPAAERIYGSLLSTDGGNAPTARAIAAAGRYYARRGQLELARKQAAALVAIDPGNPAAIFLQGFIAAADGKRPEAERSYHDALALDPQAQYWQALAQLQETAGTLGEAQASYEQALKVDPIYTPALLGLGRIHLLRHKWEPALEVLRRAAELDPTLDGPWAGMGEAHAGLNQYPEAALAYEQALRRNDQSPDTLYWLARVYFAENAGAQAIARFNEAIAKGNGAPWLSEAYRLLGYSYYSVGQREQMCTAFKHYVELARANDLMLKEVKELRASCPQ